MTIEAGALSLRITETGAEQVEQKLTRIDNKARAIGGKTVQIHMTAPGIERLDNQLEQLGKQAQLFSSGSRFASTRSQSLKEMGAVEKDLRGIIASGITPLEQRIKAEQTLASLAQKSPTLMGSLQSALGKTFVAYMGWNAVTGVYDRISSAADRQEVAQMRLGATAKLTGQSLATVTAISEKAQDQFKISAGDATDLTQAFVKMAARSGDVSKSGALMTSWMDLAAAQGLPLSQVLAAVNSALAGNDDGLNRLGLMDPSAIYRKWADAVGAHNGQLNDQQKMMAIVNEVMEKGESVRGSYSQWLDTTPGKQQQLNTEIERSAAIFGAAIAPARVWAYEVGAAILSVFNMLHRLDDTSAFQAILDMFSGNPGRAAARLVAGPNKGPALTLTPNLSPEAMAAQLAGFKPPPKHEPTAEEKAAAKRRADAIAKAMGADLGNIPLVDITAGGPRVSMPGLTGVDKDGKMKGVGAAAKIVDRELDALAERIKAKQEMIKGIVSDVAMSVGNAFGDAFSSAFSGDKNFFAAFGESLLSSLGNILMQLGGQMIAYGAIIAPLASLLSFTPFGGLGMGAGASIAAGLAITALGAAMGAVGGGGSKGGGGAGGGGGRTAKEEPNEFSVAFDPDRKLRKSSSVVQGRSRGLDSSPMPEGRHQQVFNTTVIGPDDPKAQRAIKQMMYNADARGIRGR